MPYAASELPNLPAQGPTSLALVKGQLRIDQSDTRDDDTITPLVSAVNTLVRCWPVSEAAQGDPAPADWPADIAAGATMLAARLWRRRSSPAGVEQFAGASAPAYVMRNDPDVAMLLKLGSWTPPQVG